MAQTIYFFFVKQNKNKQERKLFCSLSLFLEKKNNLCLAFLRILEQDYGFDSSTSMEPEQKIRTFKLISS